MEVSDVCEIIEQEKLFDLKEKLLELFLKYADKDIKFTFDIKQAVKARQSIYKILELILFVSYLIFVIVKESSLFLVIVILSPFVKSGSLSETSMLEL